MENLPIQKNLPVQLTYLENISGGHLRKPSQSRANSEAPCQKVALSWCSTQQIPTKRLGMDAGAQKGFAPEDMGSQGRKPSMLHGGGGETALLLVVTSAATESCG